jgi:hypothetical protein
MHGFTLSGISTAVALPLLQTREPALSELSPLAGKVMYVTNVSRDI